MKARYVPIYPIEPVTMCSVGPVALKRRWAPLPLGGAAFDVLAFDARGYDPEKKAEADVLDPKIRCPLCRWQPKRSSEWHCVSMGAPEHFSGGCLTIWNTFDTRGRCPGCKYQWRHTSCHACNQVTPHDDWYEKEAKRQ